MGTLALDEIKSVVKELLKRYGTKHQDHCLSSQERNCQRGKLRPLMCVRFK